MAVIQGIEELESKLADMERSVRRKVLRAAVKQAAELTRTRAAELAPVLTGKLKGNEIISVVDSLSTSNSVVVRVGPGMKTFYGLFDEFGTAHSTAEPFLSPAYEETKDNVLKKIAADFKEAVENI